MGRTDDILDAIVLAGDRITGPYAVRAKTNIKGLIPIRGGPVIDRVLRALREAPDIDRVCVVGPREIRNASTLIDVWTHEEGSPVENLRAGIESLGSTTRRILVCSCDMPFISCNAVRQMIQHSPIDAEICVPLICEWEFQRSFPGANRSFITLSDEQMAIGGMAILDARTITGNIKQLRRVMDARHSPTAMAWLLGLGFTAKLYSGIVTVPELEERASKITESHVRTVARCSPLLAYDIDTLRDYQDARRRVRRKSTNPNAQSLQDVYEIQVVLPDGRTAGANHLG